MANYPEQSRFRIFREHKYIFHLFTEALKRLATIDLSELDNILEVKEKFENLFLFLNSHTVYEESRISEALRQKGSRIFETATAQHESQAQKFKEVLSELDKIYITTDIDKRFYLSYILHLDLRRIFADVLIHLDYEERVVMPELQRLLSDEEIKAIDHISYKKMSPEQILSMLRTFIPHLNSDDSMVILKNIQQVEPMKFLIAWNEIKKLLSENEIEVIETTILNRKDANLKYA